MNVCHLYAVLRILVHGYFKHVFVPWYSMLLHFSEDDFPLEISEALY